MSGIDGFPEPRSEPRDDTCGWERLRDVPVCACGRAVTIRGLCRICVHDLSAQPRTTNTPAAGPKGAGTLCGCGRGCVSWEDHRARIDREDEDDEREARADRIARMR